MDVAEERLDEAIVWQRHIAAVTDKAHRPKWDMVLTRVS